jgi:hypothetical protein
MTLCIGLERPVAVKVHGALEFRLVETYYLWPILAKDLVHLLLLLLSINTLDVVVHDGELITGL